MSTLLDWVGREPIEQFSKTDVSFVNEILEHLNNVPAHDLPTAMDLAMKSIKAMDLLGEILAKLVKSVHILEARINNKRYTIVAAFKSEDGKTTAEMRKAAGEKDPEILALEEQVGYLKGLKVGIEKKLDVLSKLHFMLKEIIDGHKSITRSNSLSFLGKDDFKIE